MSSSIISLKVKEDCLKMLFPIILISLVQFVSAGLTYDGEPCGNTSDFTLWKYVNPTRYRFPKNVEVSVHSVLHMPVEYANYYLWHNKSGKIPTLQFNISDKRYDLFDWKTTKTRELDEEIVTTYFVYWDKNYKCPKRAIGVQLECLISPDYHSCKKRILESCVVLTKEQSKKEIEAYVGMFCILIFVMVVLAGLVYLASRLLIFCILKCVQLVRRLISHNSNQTTTPLVIPAATTSQATSRSLKGNRSKKVRALPPIKTKTVDETVLPRPSSPLMRVD